MESDSFRGDEPMGTNRVLQVGKQVSDRLFMEQSSPQQHSELISRDT